MIENSLGLTASHLQDPAGTVLHVPYRICAHGFFLFSPAADTALVMLPISAIEDPRFLRWLGQRGIYRIESRDGSLARVGEGRVIDRLRKHRSAPMLVPGRVSAAFGLTREWCYSTRRYLEARMAASWTEGGSALTSRTFNWTILNGRPELRAELDLRHAILQSLLETGDRILDNDADEFVAMLPDPARTGMAPPRAEEALEIEADPVHGAEVRIERARQADHMRVFPIGCRLRFDDGCICAFASVRRGEVVLHPGSQVYRVPGGQAGRNFRKAHEESAEATVVTDSAAFLIKNVTGGRVHVASRWQVT